MTIKFTIGTTDAKGTWTETADVPDVQAGRALIEQRMDAIQALINDGYQHGNIAEGTQWVSYFGIEPKEMADAINPSYS